MAYVGMVCNPSPEGAWPDEKPQPMQARYLSGLYPLEKFGPLLRTPAGHVGMDRADRWIGLSHGGHGLEDRLRENFPRVEVVILDFFDPAEKLTGLARLLPPRTKTRRTIKHGSGGSCSRTKAAWSWQRSSAHGPGHAGRAHARRPTNGSVPSIDTGTGGSTPNPWRTAGASAAAWWRARAR